MTDSPVNRVLAGLTSLASLTGAFATLFLMAGLTTATAQQSGQQNVTASTVQSPASVNRTALPTGPRLLNAPGKQEKQDSPAPRSVDRWWRSG